MKIYESEGTFSPTKKEFSFKVQATKIGEDTYEIKQYFDICNAKRYAIVAILSTKNGNENDLSNCLEDFTFAVTNISYNELNLALRQESDLKITTAVNKKYKISVYVHHAIGFDINNEEDRKYLDRYKNGRNKIPPIIAGGTPPAKGGRGILI
jgi:hypothetical protein